MTHTKKVTYKKKTKTEQCRTERERDQQKQKPTNPADYQKTNPSDRKIKEMKLFSCLQLCGKSKSDPRRYYMTFNIV